MSPLRPPAPGPTPVDEGDHDVKLMCHDLQVLINSTTDQSARNICDRSIKMLRDLDLGWQAAAEAVDEREDLRRACEEAERAMTAMIAAVKTVPEMNHHRFDAVGIQANKALARLRSLCAGGEK